MAGFSSTAAPSPQIERQQRGSVPLIEDDIRALANAAVGELVVRIIEHWRNGTLGRAVLVKLGLARWPAVDSDHYRGDVARNYLTKRLKQEMWHKEQELMSDLLDAQPDGIKVLDVPFGTGRFVGMFQKKGMIIFGIDISEDMLETAKEELGEAYNECHIEVGSADALPYDDSSFDLVVCFRFLGLLPYAVAREVLSEIRRVSRGDVIVRVPVRKDSAPVLPPIQPHELIQGQLFERQLVAFFGEFNLTVRQTLSISEREEVVFKIFVLN